jgi:hypothetical protein
MNHRNTNQRRASRRRIGGAALAVTTLIAGLGALPNAATALSPPDSWVMKASGPQNGAQTTSRSASFSLGTDTGRYFQCQLDGSSWSRCTSPKQYSNLALGTHKFRVRAVNAAGPDTTPASRTWTIVSSTPAPTPTPTPTPDPTPTPSPTPAPSGAQYYDAKSPWNTPIPAGTPSAAGSSSMISAVSGKGLLTSDPDQYAGPLYKVNNSMPLKTVNITGTWSAYDNGDQSRVGSTDPRMGQVRMPASFSPSPGSDGHIILLNTDTGEEIAFWQFENNGGSMSATNGYRYSTRAGFYGRLAGNASTGQTSGGGRGAGTPYLAGMVTREEVDRGEIPHALAIALNMPRPNEVVYPAAKTDGAGTAAMPPEGSRLQLDASFDESKLSSPIAQKIARALKRYGAYVIDNSGSQKVYMEDRITAHWPSDFTRSSVSGIPWSAFRVVTPPAKP